MKEGWSGLRPSARRPPSHPAVPTTALRRDKNTINYPERKGAVRTRPKAARISSLSVAPSLAASCQSSSPSVTSKPGSLPKSFKATFHLGSCLQRLLTYPTVLKGTAFCRQGPQTVLPWWGWDLRGKRELTLSAVLPSPA